MSPVLLAAPVPPPETPPGPADPQTSPGPEGAETPQATAARIGSGTARWFVLWGTFTRSYVAIPLFDRPGAPPGAGIVTAKRPGGLLAAMRAAEERYLPPPAPGGPPPPLPPGAQLRPRPLPRPPWDRTGPGDRSRP